MKKAVIGVSITRKNDTIYIFDSFGVGEIPSIIYKNL